MEALAELSSPTAQFDQVLEGWDLSRIKMYLIEQEGMSPEMAERIEVEYKHYFGLRLHYPGVHHPIAGPVDEMWHAHVLFTQDYARFCEAVFGKFIHHWPTVNNEERKALRSLYAKNTLPHLEELYGYDPELWPSDAQVCFCDAD